jgi:DNA adenine methylase
MIYEYDSDEEQGMGLGKDGLLRPIFCRVGGKMPIVKTLLAYVPTDIATYVEPFAGGASLYWNVSFQKAVLNDIDTKLIGAYRALKRASSNPDAYPTFNTIPEIQRFVNSPATSAEAIVMKNIYAGCNVFGNIQTKNPVILRDYSHMNKLNRLDLYKEKLSKTTLLSQDYRSVVKRYNTPSTFFFFDPPYEKSKGLYKDSVIDYEEMRDLLKQIKGKFMLTMNSSAEIRRLFSDFNIRQISVKTVTNIAQFQKVRQELIITNYVPTTRGTGMTNPWIAHVKAYATKHNMKYNEALKDPKCKSSYQKKKS